MATSNKEEKLAEYKLDLDHAKINLQTVEEIDLIELGAYMKPPTIIDHIMKGLCLVFNIKPKEVEFCNEDVCGVTLDYWTVAKSQLNDNPGEILKKMQDFDIKDVSQIDQESKEELIALIEDPEMNDTSSSFQVVSKMAEWLKAAVKILRAN